MKTYHLADKVNGIFETFKAESDEQAVEAYYAYVENAYKEFGEENTLEELYSFHYLLDENEEEI